MSKKLHILVVEDNPADADFIHEMLLQAGPLNFQVESVSRLHAALTRLERKDIDLVLLDLGLPDSQGLPTFHKLQKAVPDIPVIVLTGNDDQELAVAAMRDGAQDYLVKGQIGGSLLARAVRYALERKRTSEEAAQTAREWQTTFDATRDAIWILDQNHRVLRTNKTAESYFKRPCSEMLGKSCWEIVHGATEPLPECPFVRARQSGHRETMDLQRGDHWLEITVDPILDAAGQFAGAVHIVSDITKRRKLEEQFRQVQKMEAVGQLAAGVAHDFNNILAVIQLQANQLMTGPDSSPEQLESASEIEKAANRAANLTRQLLLFSRRQTLQPRDLDLNQSINDMTKMLRRTIGDDIQVQFKFAMEPLLLHADAGMLDQVLMNLAVNAHDAMPKGGRLVIETSAVDFDESVRVQTPLARPGCSYV